MKAATAVLLLVCASGFLRAQGTVTFQNHGAIFGDPVGVTVDRKVYSPSLGVGEGAGLTGTNWAAQLWYDSGTGLNPVPDAIRLFRLPTTTLPGTWNTDPTPTVVLPGIDIGQTTQLQVRVWDIQKFESYQAALAGRGDTSQSDIFSYRVPQPGSVPSDYTLKGLRAWAVVPEPSTVALLASATVFLLAGRRMTLQGRSKKKS